MESDAYKNDLWMWDQDWSTQTLKLKKNVVKSKKNVQNSFNEDIIDTNTKMGNKNFDILSDEYIESLEPNVDSVDVKDLYRKFEHLYELGKSLPVKRPYLAGYPAWYRKLCTKPGKDPDWTPGANNVTTSMQVGCFI